MKLLNLEMSEKSIDVQENDKDVQENDMLLAEVRRQVNPLSFCACTHFVQRIHITPHRSSAEERGTDVRFKHLLATFISFLEDFDKSQHIGCYSQQTLKIAEAIQINQTTDAAAFRTGDAGQRFDSLSIDNCTVCL